ncbi:hypothetical protein Tco_0671929 [Tanacetum coccineum]
MTRSSTKELFTPFKDPEREFRSSRKHFKTLSLDKSRSPDFDLFSNQEEYSEEEVAETMAETIEQYMSKTRADYGSGVARPKIEDKDSFELKGLLKELRDNTFSGAIPSKTAADAKVAIQEMVEYSQKWHTGTSRTRRTKTLTDSSQTKHNSTILERNLENWQKDIEGITHLDKEIQASTDAAIGNQGASIKTLEIQIGQMSKVLQERGFGSVPSSTEANLRDQVKSISTIIEADSYLI